MTDKSRIVELQRSLRIARTALEKIRHGHGNRSPAGVAEDALDEMRPLEPKQSLAGICGHERRPRG